MNTLVKNKTDVLSVLRRILSSEYFPIFTAVMSVANYYLGFDLLNIYIYGAGIIAMILLLDDLAPILPQMLFLAVICSEKNSPMFGNSGYYTTPAVFIQIACIIGFIVIAAVYRFVKQARAGKVRVTPVFVSVIVLALAYMLNGAFSSEYGANDTLYGVILAASLLPIYMLLSCTVKVNDENIAKVCMGFFIFSIVLVIEMVVGLARLDIPAKEITSQVLRSNCFRFGWGIWNNLGMLLVICIAPVMYLSVKKRCSPFFIIWATLLCGAVIVSTSRQAYIGAAVAYVLSAIYMLVKSRGRKYNYIVFGIVFAAAVALLVFLFVSYTDWIIATLTYNLFDVDGDFTGSTRVTLYGYALDNFLNSPLFGVGFYAENMIEAYYTSMSWFPHFYHNTIAQVMGACGAVGLAAYIFHRVCTAVAFAKNRSTGRTFIAISMLAYLVMGLLDNHMFYILSAFIYPVLTAFVTNPAEDGKHTVKEEKPAKRGALMGGKSGAETIFEQSEAEDGFLNTLTKEEREEFYSFFINGGEERLSYEVGGDNESFFKNVFVGLGSYLGVVSYGLMKKIEAYAKTYDVK